MTVALAGDITRCPPLFLRGGDTILVCHGRSLKLHSLRERKQLGRVLVTASPIVSLVLLKADNLEARGYLSSKKEAAKGEDLFRVGVVEESGLLTTIELTRRSSLWSWEAQEPFRVNVPTGEEILFWTQAAGALDTFLCVTKSRSDCGVYLVDGKMHLTPLRRFSHVRTVAISDTGRFVAVVGCLASIQTGGSFCTIIETLKNSHIVIKGSDQAFVSLCFHPEEKYIALGSVAGSITRLFCLKSLLFDKDTDSPMEATTDPHFRAVQQHWHHTPCTSIRVSPCRTFLLSGGAEGVLVLWNERTQEKQFLSRLGAPVTAISTTVSRKGHILVACALANNSIVVVDLSQMRVIHTVASFVIPLQFHNNPDLNIAASWKQKAKSRFQLGVVPASLTGDMQVLYNRSSQHAFRPRLPETHELRLFDMASDLACASLDVGDREYVSNAIDDVYASFGLVFSQFSTSGAFLLTVEERTAEEGSTLSRLKLWEAKRNDGKVTVDLLNLTTCEDRVTGVVAVGDLFVTLHSASWRIWLPADTLKCEALGAYKGLAILDAAVSPDGLTLAIVHKNCVSLWTGDRLTSLERCLVPRREVKSEWQRKIRGVAFAEEHFVVGRSTDVCVFEIKSGKALKQIIPAGADVFLTRIISAGNNISLQFVDEKRRLQMFERLTFHNGEVSTGEPWQVSAFETILGGVYVDDNLILLNRMMELLPQRELAETTTTSPEPEAEDSPVSMDLLVPTPEFHDPEEKYREMTGSAALLKAMAVNPNGASHMLPPPSTLLARVLGSLLN
ncbi:MAG: uncharacterized protein KVP18_001987 [Porospora cf. gigantea A]|uniref:uncharacterized protein n=2 Tax=Porospora cf. gigantea A TaxID=2853593 RepID=UPI00355A243E|nr:MAG: hypothetical protein KVP18_001987 [Porospora cf. gigantea A]